MMYVRDGQSPLPSALIVEDHPDISDLLRTIMADSYATACVGDVAGALAHLRGEALPDLVLLDCFLPGENCAPVLAMADALGCAVVLMSGLREALAELAAFGYPCLEKPFTVAQLFGAIEAATTMRHRDIKR